MKHDFETVVSRRNCGSIKWEQMLKNNPNAAADVAPLSVADMELKNPPEIIEGLKDYLDTHILGYTAPTKAYYDAVCGWMKHRHGWDVKPEEIILTNGVVPALFTAVLAYTEPGDGVITMPPVYGPFGFSIKQNGRVNVECPLLNDNEYYTIDFDRFEALCAEPKNKMFILCSPHNPAGRVWSRAELSKIGEICAHHSVLVVSDEIHFDLIMPGNQHTVSRWPVKTAARTTSSAPHRARPSTLRRSRPRTSSSRMKPCAKSSRPCWTWSTPTPRRRSAWRPAASAIRAAKAGSTKQST